MCTLMLRHWRAWVRTTCGVRFSEPKVVMKLVGVGLHNFGFQEFDMSDPYKVLGISRDATDDEVKQAYRKLSRK